MPGRLLRYIQVMNALSVFCFVLCCLHNLSLHSNAEPDGGALSVVSQEDDNGEVTVEVNGEDETVPATQTKPREPVDVFYPTHEWQVVKEGQTIPAGLHVRMDFETGVREAKLMEGDSGLKYWKAGQREGGINPDKKTLSMNELKKAIIDFKTTDIDEVDLEREAEVKSKFLSYEELKKDFESMNIGIKTDGEIIEGLVGKLKDNNLDKDQLIITLMDLEYYLHQVDNGILFKDIGGLPLIVKVINSSLDEEVQIEAAMVLGAATSSNPQVQVGAMEAQVLHILLRLLSTHSSVNLQRKIMFAISSLCRHFPHAQKQFLELGGLSVFGKVFEESGMEKIQVKAVSFLNDLLTEKDLIIKNTVSKKSDAVERLRQYDLVPLREAMKEQGWCDRIPKLLHVSEHDSREHVLLTMKTLGQTCKKQFSTSKSNLNNLKLEYTDLAKAEVGDEDKYFTNLLTLISELEHTFAMKEEL